VKQLPSDFTPGRFFDLFRPFGPIYRATLQASPHGAEFSGLGLIEFYNEEHAIRAEKEMHCADLAGQTIAVQVYEPKKVTSLGPALPSFFLRMLNSKVTANQGPISGISSSSAAGWAEAPEFIPAAATRSFSNGMNASVPPWNPMSAQLPQRSFSGPALAPSSQYNVSSSGIVIDPTNLFIKNLDSSVTSQDLFAAFKPFGRIVSARVMRDDKTGLSKEFGFVSYQKDDEAAQALKAMDGSTLTGATGGSSTIVVRLHEPKRFRGPRLQNQFSNSGQAGVDDITARFGTLSAHVRLSICERTFLRERCMLTF
jgi:polyadenylate-binding protein